MFVSSLNNKHFFDISFVLTTGKHVDSGFWMCVRLSYKGTLSTLGNVFSLEYVSHLHTVISILTPVSVCTH